MVATNLKHQYDIGVAAITVYRVLKRNNKIKERKRMGKEQGFTSNKSKI